ncbi:tyrosine-type recombinase/integrase [Chryseobacterium sp. R2A-55]|uniref:tyrosine-type recombinase/integrase n=1 Tax=Chryseobacterium sp. R2A-55 TaxID=2744445 RepID=UPI001F25CACE|nr:site-specific integrase [Chryseobacterium sp. R2A-55]
MRKKLKELPNGCSRTEVFVSPKNYKSIKNKSQLPKYWFVECRFFDPHFAEKYPAGFQYRKKFSGASIQELKTAAEIYKDEMENTLDVLKYNPLSKIYMNDRSSDLHPGLYFVEALEKTFEKLKTKYKTNEHRKQVRCMIARIKSLQYKARLDLVRITEIRTWHIKNLLDIMDLTDSVYNKFRNYLSTLFKELAQYGCVDTNYIRDISKREENPKVRKVLTPEKFEFVFNYLKENLPEFFRYATIFHYSGARSSELMRLKRSDVDFERREFRVLVLKGRKHSWETKAIIPSAAPYWESLLQESIYDDEYMFSHFQCPGDTKISARAITQKWNRHVKNSKEIKDLDGNIIEVDEDFYSLKHLFLEKLDQMQDETPIIDINLAQGAASHKSNRTTGIYTVGRKNRAVEYLKNVNIS